MARKKIVAGNWKMNKTPSEAVALVEELKPLVANEDVDVVFCVPAIDIIPVAEAVKGTNIQVGAENMYFEESGAYTGEISPAMLTDAGVKYVVLGHSERREYFAETNETVNWIGHYGIRPSRRYRSQDRQSRPHGLLFYRRRRTANDNRRTGYNHAIWYRCEDHYSQ